MVFKKLCLEEVNYSEENLGKQVFDSTELIKLPTNLRNHEKETKKSMRKVQERALFRHPREAKVPLKRCQKRDSW